ncbi:protein Niban-like [Echeneis naucrates]|uniref:Protein Niban-like n=1 Tax=Echeneis naucrates TaxID=173247 RepID=A0A665WA65_ECHNA|nr:protein Niban-like [Echeneis naucrates]
MGASASSLLDVTTSSFVKGQAEAELKEFSPYYRKQFSVAHFSQLEDELEQHKEKISQLLRQREAPPEAEVLYEEAVLYFDETRKWRDRYVVVRANYCLECHESLESFVKGVPPRYKLLPTGGTVLTTEEPYMAKVDCCFPDDTNVKEDFAPPLSGMPGQFPVYLRLPYRRDSYFCFKQQAKRDAFLSILSDCIRHQNQDFLKKKTCDVQAFLKAIQLYRQDKGKYEAWDMLIGSDVRVMANLVMEQLLPSLEKDMLPCLKAKKTEKKRIWFATVEAVYILIQECLLEGLSQLKDECLTSVRQQEVLIHSDMDQIINSRQQLEEKVRAKVLEPAEKLCSESVQPYLGSILEELMEPISSGFGEGRQLSESMMDQLCQDFLVGQQNEQLKKALADMARPNLLSCYQKIGSLEEKMQHLQERFGFSNITGVIHSAQIDLQLLMENAACTFEQLLCQAVQANPDNANSAIEKAKHRVLKQYDYDSSTVRKRICQEALVSITLPFIKKNLAPTCKTELQCLEQLIYADHSNFIHVENVYESILLQTLDKEVTKVVKEAASLKKYNLFTDSRDLISPSSRSSLSSPPVSTPGSPAMGLASPSKTAFTPQPTSPLAVNGPQKEEQKKSENGTQMREASGEPAVMETPLGTVHQKESSQRFTVGHEEETPSPKVEEVIQTVKAEADATIAPETAALVTTITENDTKEVNIAAAPEVATQEEVTLVETAAEPETQSAEVLRDAEVPLTESPAIMESLKTNAEDPAGPTSAGETSFPTEVSSEEDGLCESSEVKLEAPSSGEVAAVIPEVSMDVKENEAVPLPVSDPNSLDISVGSQTLSLDVEPTVKTAQSSKEEVSTISDVLEEEANISKSPVSSDNEPEAKSTNTQPSPQMEAEVSGDVSVSGKLEDGASVNPEVTSPTSGPNEKETPSDPNWRPPDCIKDIRDLVVEVIEVEELMQRYPSGVTKDE